MVKFNDNVYLRSLIYRLGLSWTSLPDLLNLEEALYGKIINFYNLVAEDKLVPFLLRILAKYSSVSSEVFDLRDSLENEDSEAKREVIELKSEYLQSRRVPLMRVITYFMPKLKKICKNNS